MFTNILLSILIISLSSFLWRVRGGLDIWKNNSKVPFNKIWYAIAFGIYGCCFYGFHLENWLVGFIDCYTSYQLYGWGLYIGRLLSGETINPEKDFECELIDNLLYSMRISFGENSTIVWNWFFGRFGWNVVPRTYYLYEFPKLFGFIGTSLTGLIITFLWGLYLNSFWFMISGLGMSVCYWLGSLIEKKIPLGKNGWNWGEWIFGGYEGIWLSILLLW